MPRDTETIIAANRQDAISQIFDLYPTLTSYEITSRRNSSGQFSSNGHTFTIKVQWTYEPDDEPIEFDLGEDEY